MNMLVTGGAGFIGSRLVRELLSQGHSVLSVDREPHSIEGATCAIIPLKTLIETSMDDRVDCVFHCAARISVTESFFQWEAYYMDNVKLTQLVADRWGNKVIFISSCAVEDIQSPYALTKKLGEQVVQKRGGRVVRLYNVYGPGSSGVIETWIQRIKDGEDLIVHGQGGRVRSFIHVDTVVKNLARLRPNSQRDSDGPPEPYLLGGLAMSLGSLSRVFQESAKRILDRDVDIVFSQEVHELDRSIAPVCMEDGEVLRDYIDSRLKEL